MRAPLNKMEIRTPAREKNLATKEHVSRFLGAFGDHVRTPTPNNRHGIHQGWDLYATPGTSSYAIANGTVQSTSLNFPGYGGMVVVKFEHNGRTLYALYAHLRALLVQVGQSVNEGSPVGLTGTSGNAKGETPHLHFGIMTTPEPHHGLTNFISPGHILGYHYQGLTTDDHARFDVG